MTWTHSIYDACLKLFSQHPFYNAYTKTFAIVPADTAELRDRAYRLRYRVYCIENHFIPAPQFPDERECDAFDERARHFLMVHKPTGETAGTVRVLMPDEARPLLSFELQKSCNHPLLQIENRVLGLCEISRLCMADRYRRRPLDGRLLPAYYDQDGEDVDGKPVRFRRLIPYAPLGLLRAAFETAMESGVQNCLLTLEAGQDRHFERMGISGQPLGLHLRGLQPSVLSIKSVMDSMADANPPCWEVLTDRGRLHRRAGVLFRRDMTAPYESASI